MRNARTTLRALLAISVLGIPIVMAQTGSPGEESSMVRNRVQDGLRGPVKSCSEVTTIPAVPDIRSEIRSKSTTEYDPEGRVSSIRNEWNDSQWIMRYEYGPSGQLLKIASGSEEKNLGVSSYLYDEQGSIQKIVTDGQSARPVPFHYGQDGRKTSTEASSAEDYRPNQATAGGPFEGLAHAPNLPGGGTATTFYDDHDRPSEIEVRDAAGQLVMHAVRRYDAQGRVSEEERVGRTGFRSPLSTEIRMLIPVSASWRTSSLPLHGIERAVPGFYGIHSRFPSWWSPCPWCGLALYWVWVLCLQVAVMTSAQSADFDASSCSPWGM